MPKLTRTKRTKRYKNKKPQKAGANLTRWLKHLRKRKTPTPRPLPTPTPSLPSSPTLTTMEAPQIIDNYLNEKGLQEKADMQMAAEKAAEKAAAAAVKAANQIEQIKKFVDDQEIHLENRQLQMLKLDKLKAESHNLKNLIENLDAHKKIIAFKLQNKLQNLIEKIRKILISLEFKYKRRGSERRTITQADLSPTRTEPEEKAMQLPGNDSRLVTSLDGGRRKSKRRKSKRRKSRRRH